MRSKMSSPNVQGLRIYIAKYLNSIENIESYSPHTVRSYRVDLGQAFGVLTASDPEILRKPLPAKLPLTEDELLSSCRNAMSGWAALAPASRNRKAATLKSFLNWLFNEELLKRDLALQIHGPKVPHRLPHHLSVDEVLALLKSLSEQIENAESNRARRAARADEALVLLLYGGGLRVSEACGLRWKDVDLSAHVLRIQGKGGKERLVALPDKVLRSLAKMPREGDYVFGDEPLSTRKAYEHVRTQGSRAGLMQALHPHALRHSFATHLLTSGANLRTLQELLGHRSLQATQRYTHIGIDQLARTMEKFHPHGNDRAPARGRTKGKSGS